MDKHLRDFLMAGTSRLIMSASEGADDPAAGGGGAPAAAAPAAEGGEATQPAAAAPDAPAGEEGGDAGAEAEGAPEAEAKPARVPWQVKRIGELTAQNKAAAEAREAAEKAAADAQAAADRYRALYGELPPGDAAPTSPPPPPPPSGERVYTAADVQTEAARLANLAAINQRCDTMFDTGAKTHTATWNTRINAVGQAFGPDLAKRVDFFEAITALPNGAEVYHELAGDLDHMAEVLAMQPVQLGMELARISTKAAAKPRGPAVSKVPDPINPIDGGGGAETDLAKVPMDEYARTREAQRAARMKERGLA